MPRASPAASCTHGRAGGRRRLDLALLCAAIGLAALTLATAIALAGCRAIERAPAAADGDVAGDVGALAHDAYVWQRAWTGAVSASVARAPVAIDGLRVLMAEVEASGAVTWPAVDLGALAAAGRPVTAVVRVDGARLPAGELLGGGPGPLGPALARVLAWRRAGVDVVGLELDHDAATAAVPAYAAWLRAARAASPAAPSLRWSITALPAWASSPALAELAAAVDEVVVQVHAVRAPRLFEPALARRWLEDVAAAIPHARLRVALPTYAVTVGRARLAADPREVAALVRALERRPVAGVVGVVWFRLPTDGDRASWPAPTLAAVIAGAPLVAAVEARLVATGRDLRDIVLANRGTVDGAWPTLRITGALTASDLLGGYLPADADGAWTAPARTIAPGEELVLGWATGKDLRLDAP